MNLNIDFSSQVSDRLTAAAHSRGVDLATVLETLVTQYLPSTETSVSAMFPPTGRAAARLRARLAAEATDDPETIRKAQDALDDMKRSMNAERQRSGAEPIF